MPIETIIALVGLSLTCLGLLGTVMQRLFKLFSIIKGHGHWIEALERRMDDRQKLVDGEFEDVEKAIDEVKRRLENQESAG